MGSMSENICAILKMIKAVCFNLNHSDIRFVSEPFSSQHNIDPSPCGWTVRVIIISPHCERILCEATSKYQHQYKDQKWGLEEAVIELRRKIEKRWKAIEDTHG